MRPWRIRLVGRRHDILVRHEERGRAERIAPGPAREEGVADGLDLERREQPREPLLQRRAERRQLLRRLGGHAHERDEVVDGGIGELHARRLSSRAMDARDDERAAGSAADDAAAMIAQLRASGSVFAEEELAVLRAHADAIGGGDEEWAADRLELFIDRRVHGERIEHIVERAQFAELRIQVDFGVFVPRSRTVLLATVVADRLREVRDARPAGRPPRLLDFGCGAGPIAALATHRVPGIDVVAVDADPRAVATARRNLPLARVMVADSVLALVAADAEPPADDVARIRATAPFDVVAANLPYVPTAQLPLLPHGTLESEPLLALDGGDSGLDPLGEHALALGAMLADGGILVTELAPHQVELGIEILDGAGLHRVEVRSDDELGATVLVAAR